MVHQLSRQRAQVEFLLHELKLYQIETSIGTNWAMLALVMLKNIATIFFRTMISDY